MIKTEGLFVFLMIPVHIFIARDRKQAEVFQKVKYCCRSEGLICEISQMSGVSSILTLMFKS